MRGAIDVTFEEGTQAQWLHDLLVGRVGKVLVCDRRGKSRRGNKVPGKRVYHGQNREEWLAKPMDGGVRFRAQALYAQLDVLRELRPKVKAAMVAEARRDPAWTVLRSLPFLGTVRVALILAIMRTPWRFRTQRNLWSQFGLAVVTQSSAGYALVGSKPV